MKPRYRYNWITGDCDHIGYVDSDGKTHLIGIQHWVFEFRDAYGCLATKKSPHKLGNLAG